MFVNTIYFYCCTEYTVAVIDFYLTTLQFYRYLLNISYYYGPRTITKLTGKIIVFQAEPSDTIGHLKSRIQHNEGKIKSIKLSTYQLKCICTSSQ